MRTIKSDLATKIDCKSTFLKKKQVHGSLELYFKQNKIHFKKKLKINIVHCGKVLLHRFCKAEIFFWIDRYIKRNEIEAKQNLGK